MQVQDDDRVYDDINITPMLDLAYVLLIVFIILTTASVQGIKVDLPKASSATSLAKPKTKAITINSNGDVFLDAYPVTLPELETRLRTAKATEPEFPIVVKGDAVVQYQRVTDVLDLLRRLDLNQVGLVTGRAEER
ncbi:ExbD/TolR family protein [Caulobacter soli]|uniref:ExbD/TolR family protein n=1 Tax=Caulobacter soli TaxID=2708539 RepID=UPI0013EC474D|nr:biopolymer transporter ExbD [Caulobacter soli]